MNCPNPECNTPLPENAKFCPECGEQLTGLPHIQVTQKIGKMGSGSKAYGVVINPKDTPEELLKAYYRSLAAECSRLPLGAIDTVFVETSGDIPLALEQVYIDLDVITPPPQEQAGSERAWVLKLERGEGRDRRALLDAMVKDAGKKTVLLGDAGSGKTTFVNYLTFALACGVVGEARTPKLPKEFQKRLAVRLVLRDVAAQRILPGARPGKAQMLWGALQDDIADRFGDEAAKKLFPYLQEQLLQKGGIILLDGLDEVPEAHRRREALREAVVEFAHALPEKSTRLLVTARPYAYADRAWRLGEFSTLALASFNEEQVGRFIERWYQAAWPWLGWTKTEADRRASRLQQALQERDYLADLASRPLLLTLMAALHSSHGQLPEDRADLYEETVKLLLSRWQKARQTSTADGTPVVEPSILQVLGIGEEKLRNMLEALAYHAHEAQGRGAQRDQAPADISEGDLLLAFKPLLGQVAPETLLSYLKERAGLLIERRGGVYSFPHRSFQEYLAACYLADQPEFALELEKLVCSDPGWWREVCLFGIGKAKRGGLSQAAGVVNHLLPADPPGVGEVSPNQWRVSSLVGQGLIELRLAQQAAGQESYQALLKRSRNWLVQVLARSSLPARERSAAGIALAALGDPRFDPARFFLPDEPLLGFVPIPAGPFLMGSDKETDKNTQDREQPQHEVTLPDYYLARYPVTNAQFVEFVRAGGYAEARYWLEAKAAKIWQDGAVKGFLDNQPRNSPYDYGQPFNLANHPVVGVTWYEALAYCRWLGEKLSSISGQRLAESGLSSQESAFWQGLAQGKLVLSLPSEAEWEKAARGPLLSPLQGERLGVRVFPWGDAFDPDKANTAETGLGATSALGCFPGGLSPYGLLEMSGNVWEWTRSLWGAGSEKPDFGYPYSTMDGREDLNAGDRVLRVLRGGAFVSGAADARCAFRNWDDPGSRWDRVGFRVGAFGAYSGS